MLLKKDYQALLNVYILTGEGELANQPNFHLTIQMCEESLRACVRACVCVDWIQLLGTIVAEVVRRGKSLVG